MLSYQHSYHAGCFADVLKHTVLSQILSYMVQKDKPLFYMETHSGRGLYRLNDQHALKTQEFKSGIAPVWQQRQRLPDVFNPYLDVCRSLNSTKVLKYYPGSPSIALNILREQDRLYLCELHPQEFGILSEMSKLNKRVFFCHDDGIKQLKAQIPPTERRGLIFIDPAFEVKTEYRDIPRAIQSAHERFKTGVYALWYPLIDTRLNDQLIRGLSKINAPALQIELHLNREDKPGMKGCGLWIINPPYVLCEQASQILDTLKPIFNATSWLKSYP